MTQRVGHLGEEIPLALEALVAAGRVRWPNAVPGLGRRRIGPFAFCIGCGRGSWARYGVLVLCCQCAIARLGSGSEETTPWP